MTDIPALIARVGALTGPDREVECELVTAFISYNEAVLHRHYSISGYCFTASVDAAISLVERVLSGWYVEHIGADAIGSQDAMRTVGWTAELRRGGALAQGQATTLPVALVLAALKALQAQEANR